MDKRLIGILGEKLAAKWYQDKGFEIIAHNYKTRQGELDIVARKDRLVVVCEVKTRKSAKYTQAREAVTYQKQEKIKLATLAYISEKQLSDVIIRFDVAEIYHPDNDAQITILENAFE